MLFRNIYGQLVEINRYDYKNDAIYYTKIMELYKVKITASNINSEYKTLKTCSL